MGHYLESSFSVMEQTDLLQWLGNAKKTGVLRVTRESTVHRIYFKDGVIVASSSNEPRLLLGQFLIGHGRLDEGSLQEFMRLQERTGQPLGQLLVEAGKISEPELLRLVTAKAEEVVFGLFEWPQGDFRFEAEASPPKDGASVELNVHELLLEGIRRLDELKHIRDVFRSPYVVLHRTDVRPDPPMVASHLGRRLYDLIDGHRTMGEIILLCRTSEYLAGYFLVRLLDRGMIHVGETREPDVDVTQDITAIGRLRELVASGEYEEAVDLIDRCALTAGADELLGLLIAKAEAGLLANAYRSEIPPDAVPERIHEDRLAGSGETLPSEDLFLLDLIDGHWDVRSLGWIAPMRKVDVVRGLLRLLRNGYITLHSMVESQDAPGPRPAPEATPVLEGRIESDIDTVMLRLGG